MASKETSKVKKQSAKIQELISRGQLNPEDVAELACHGVSGEAITHWMSHTGWKQSSPGLQRSKTYAAVEELERVIIGKLVDIINYETANRQQFVRELEPAFRALKQLKEIAVKISRSDISDWSDVFEEAQTDKDFKIFVHDPVEIKKHKRTAKRTRKKR